MHSWLSEEPYMWKYGCHSNLLLGRTKDGALCLQTLDMIMGGKVLKRARNKEEI